MTSSEQDMQHDQQKTDKGGVTQVVLGGAKAPLLIGMALGIVALGLGGFGPNSPGLLDLSLPEKVFTTCLTLFTVLGSALVLLTRKALVAYIAAAGSFFTFGFSIFSVWMEQTGMGAGNDTVTRVGYYLGMLAAILVLSSLVTIVFRRTPAQIAAAQARTTKARRVETELENNLIAHRTAASETPDAAATEVDERRKRHRGRQNKSQPSPE
ncbi:hypothetical protein [Corynebacterium ulceribovis]|uniref:Rv2732c family membrane protein n=1 Tax=Corynebacterium ulceribovis TaxID=487732 RepID=UPI00036783DF|nr:hypothetical protein [Corynebacterium ulceribovis]